MFLRWGDGLSRDGAVSGSHSYCFGVHITFHIAQHCSVVRQRGHFIGAQVQHQTTEIKIKKRGLIDDVWDGNFVVSLCYASYSKQIWDGADAFPRQGQHRSWPLIAWAPFRLQLTAGNIDFCPVDLIALLQTGDGICFYSYRTESVSPATRLDTIQQTAALTPWKSFRRQLVGKGDEDRQKLRGWELEHPKLDLPSCALFCGECPWASTCC